ncbi:HAD family hydrolase [Candidatus Poribacteria bacterium]|jgi:alcohol-forming fatty acyl-CoA reductase|nr:HAD family hydrolase [Candidatus Poribacteria bacterium]MBT5532897.1 HAD family hydrolase [Candidatus Poribacteria bacterium]MBT5715171.1 HAD family hydrolase [Candidatus Poribacteria bacterium]MBT7099264.1 HAD family hydrolase [Candidatus Poribacteria bacterium]MBT7803916.1 HAD family hydrolase [Candidatus Poribacteria bacterium]
MTQASNGSIGAFFDVDGTLLDTTIVHFYARLMTARMSRLGSACWTAAFVPRLPVFLAVDRVSRTRFNTMFYRLYRGRDAGQTREDADGIVPGYATTKLYADAGEAIRRHIDDGHTVVLVTGTADFVARPIAGLLGVDDVLATELAENDGCFTGEIIGDPLSGDAKARAVVEFAERRGIEVSRSYAYGDSTADADMLAVVGNPVAVNPSRRMARQAAQRGWDIRAWS